MLKLLYAFSISQKRHITENAKDGRLAMNIPSEILKQSMASVFEIELPHLEDNFIDAKFSTGYDGFLYPQAVFIPAKEMLSHAKGLLSMKTKYGENMPFDASLLDIIEKAQAWKLSKVPELAENIAESLEKIMGGIVELKKDGSFWMKKSNGSAVPFSMEADGLKRLGLLWQLLMNEGISRGTVVLWDEPEASINPENIPLLVDVMLRLQRQGVQIIAATHSYNFARYFDILREADDAVQFYSFYKSKEGFTYFSQSDVFTDLIPNLIDDAG